MEPYYKRNTSFNIYTLFKKLKIFWVSFYGRGVYVLDIKIKKMSPN